MSSFLRRKLDILANGIIIEYVKVGARIERKIKRIAKGKSFGYTDLGISKDEYLTAAKALERLQAKGLIKKLSKGVFYKPTQTVFGELKPEYGDQLRRFLFENGKRIAYVTGPVLYNQMNLTTQVAFRLKIASRNKRVSINRGPMVADAVKSYAEVTEGNYRLLGLLDAFKDIKRIQDTETKTIVKVLIGTIKELDESQLSALVKYALLYPPRVRSLVGAILENLNADEGYLIKLRKSVNPLTTIQLGIEETDLPTARKWNIK